MIAFYKYEEIAERKLAVKMHAAYLFKQTSIRNIHTYVYTSVADSPQFGQRRKFNAVLKKFSLSF